MSASDAFESNLLKLIFNNTTLANVGDATGLVGSTAAGSLYVGLHTADPGETGTQSTNEATYSGYARVGIVRTTGGWTVSGTAPTQAVNAATVTWPTCTAGSSTCTHWSVGTASSGTGSLLMSGALTSSVAVSTGNPVPSAAAGALVVTLD